MRLMRQVQVILAVAATALTAACASGPSGGERTPSTSDPAARTESSPATSDAPDRPAIRPEAERPAQGIFTEEQAERGRAAFRTICSECHYSNEFRGTQFQLAWGGRTVWDFFREMSRTMPEDAPGSLQPQQYADVVAYVLRANGLASGDTELTPEEAILDSYSMAAPDPGPR